MLIKRLAFLCFGCWSFSCLGGSAHAQADIFRIERPDFASRYLVQEIIWPQSEHLELIKLTLGFQVGQRVTAEELQAGEDNLLKTGLFGQSKLFLKPLSQGYALIVNVVALPKIQKIIFLNTPTLFPVAQWQQKLDFQRGQFLDLSRLSQVLAEIESIYHASGYSLALVEKVLEPQYLEQGILALRIHEGVIESYRLVGNLKTRDKVLLRELRLKPGDIFRTAIFEADIARLLQTGYFKRLDFSVLPGQVQPFQSILELTVNEAETLDIGLDGTFNNRDGLMGGFHIQEDNFLGQGQRLGIQIYAGVNLIQAAQGQWAQSQRAALGSLDFYDPWLGDLPLALGASIFSERVPFFWAENLQQQATGVSLSLSKRWNDLIPALVKLEGKIEKIQIMDWEGKPRPDLTLARRPSAMDQRFQILGTLSHDTRDQAIEPSTGMFTTLQAGPVWGDGTFVQIQGAWRGILRIWADWKLALDLQGGILGGEIPAYAQFVANGSRAIRGWPENQGIFGTSYWLGSLETRFPIYDFISGVIFADLGQYHPGPWRWGTGLGLRFNTPLGLLRLDYGVRDFQGWGWHKLLDLGQLHFNLGHKF